MKYILLIAGSLTIASPFSYLYQVAKKEVRPSILSWYGWSVLMGISIISQIVTEGWSSNLVTITLSAVGCFTIAFSARHIFGHFSLNKKDWSYIYSGAGCILFYFLFSNQWLTTLLAISADFILAIPTLKMAYSSPQNEKSYTWPLSLASWVTTFSVLLFNFNWIFSLWPIYLILFNGTMTFLTFFRSENNNVKNRFGSNLSYNTMEKTTRGLNSDQSMSHYQSIKKTIKNNF
jgi:hypothetical protein